MQNLISDIQASSRKNEATEHEQLVLEASIICELQDHLKVTTKKTLDIKAQWLEYEMVVDAIIALLEDTSCDVNPRKIIASNLLVKFEPSNDVTKILNAIDRLQRLETINFSPLNVASLSDEDQKLILSGRGQRYG